MRNCAKIKKHKQSNLKGDAHNIICTTKLIVWLCNKEIYIYRSVSFLLLDIYGRKFNSITFECKRSIVACTCTPVDVRLKCVHVEVH